MEVAIGTNANVEVVNSTQIKVSIGSAPIYLIDLVLNGDPITI